MTANTKCTSAYNIQEGIAASINMQNKVRESLSNLNNITKAYSNTYIQFISNLKSISQPITDLQNVMANIKPLSIPIEDIGLKAYNIVNSIDKIQPQLNQITKIGLETSNKINTIAHNGLKIYMNKLTNLGIDFKQYSSLLESTLEKNSFSTNINNIQKLNLDKIEPIISDFKINDSMDKEVLSSSTISNKEYEEVVKQTKSILNECKIQDKETDQIVAINNLTAVITDLNKSINNEQNQETNWNDWFIKTILGIILAKLIESITPYILSLTLLLFNPNSYNQNISIKQAMQNIKDEPQYTELKHTHYNTIRIVIKDDLEVRKEKNINSFVIYRLDFLDKVQIISKHRNWCKVKYINIFTDELKTGWVLTRYLKKIN